jgi:enterobactin synthetase component D
MLALGAVQSSLGIDLESFDKIHTGLYEKICTSKELRLLDGLSPPLNDLVAMVFSAKESIYKCIYPIGKTFFYFHDAEIVSYENDKICLRLLKDTSPVTPTGTTLLVEVQELKIDERRFAFSICSL